jgi:predicted MFS family arabinose efflux permease
VGLDRGRRLSPAPRGTPKGWGFAPDLDWPAMAVADRHARIAAGVAVGLVLADSSVVVLALPAIYRELDVSVSAVVWVLVAFNLVLATAAVPAAHAAGRVGAARLTVGGLAVFAASSLACGLAPSIEVLILARAAQAIGGAAAVCASLELMPALYGSERAAARTWAAAGATGAALGPAVGGLLTELVSWQSIFLLQVPIALVVAAPLLGAAGREGAGGPAAGAAGRPHLAANLALALVSAALAAALFLVVLLLIEGWRLSPIVAALAVSAMPLAALAAGAIASGPADGRARAAAGAILLAGGLAGLALLPDASIAATLAPQALVGIGLALTLSALTEAALAGRAPQALHGGWTIAARHAGVVAGLLVMTPIFTADLESERADAEQAGTAAVLDARLDPTLKIELAERLAERLRAEGDKVPVLGPAFEPLPDDPDERADAITLRTTLEDELDRAATHAFSASFLVAAAFALAALLPIALARERPSL